MLNKLSGWVGRGLRLLSDWVVGLGKRKPHFTRPFSNEVSIVITYHNEGKEFLLQAIDSLETTIDIPDYEIIVVDDCSKEKITIDGVRVIRNLRNVGVGASFDIGISSAKYDNIFFMACDIRFDANGWASKMLGEIHKHPTSLICTAVVPLQAEMPEIDFQTAKKWMKIDSHKGAEIVWFIGDDDHVHQVIEARWYPREFLPLRAPDYVTPTECYEVECILGAFYGVRKEWYQHIDGFWGHKFWGKLEPLISLKSWMFGGSCLVAPHIETAHIFKNAGNHDEHDKYVLFKTHNALLLIQLLLPDSFIKKLIQWLPDRSYVVEALGLMPDLADKRREYKRKTVFTFEEFLKKFNKHENSKF
jgi:glycosyltransferase involved in cell wall biosynthesis